MRRLISVIFSFLCGMSALAFYLKPSRTQEGKTTISWISDNNPVRTEQIQTFEDLNPTVLVRLDSNNKGMEKLLIQCASGVGPDLYDMNGVNLQTTIDAGIALNITEDSKKMGFSLEEATWPGARGDLSFEGKQYSYPAGINVPLLFYNKNVFDKLGIPYPKDQMTWTEYLELATQIRDTSDKAGKRIYGIGIVNFKFWTFVFNSLRGEYFTPEGTDIQIHSPEMKTAFELQKKVLAEGLLPRALEAKSMAGQGGWGGSSIGLFADGRFATLIVNKYALIRMNQSRLDQLAKLKKWENDPNRKESEKPEPLRVGVVSVPHFEGREPCYYVRTRSVAINPGSKNIQDSLLFLKYLSGPEYSRIVNENFDGIPGNPKHQSLGVGKGPPDLSEIEAHEVSVRDIARGYQPQKSSFLLESDIDRIINEELERLEADNSLSVDVLLQEAQEQLKKIMQKNLHRSPSLLKKHQQLVQNTKS